MFCTEMGSRLPYIVIGLYTQRQHAHTVHSSLKCGKPFQSSLMHGPRSCCYTPRNTWHWIEGWNSCLLSNPYLSFP